MSAQGGAAAAGGLGAGSALLVIDVQQQPLSELSSGERRAEFLAVLASLVERARERGMPVVYVRHSDEWMRPGSDDWQIAPEVAPLAGEAIVEKPSAMRSARRIWPMCWAGSAPAI